MLVQAPDLPRMLCMKGTKYYGLYTYKNAWDAEKKRSYRVKGSTKCVGIMVSGDKTGKKGDDRKQEGCPGQLCLPVFAPGPVLGISIHRFLPEPDGQLL